MGAMLWVLGIFSNGPCGMREYRISIRGGKNAQDRAGVQLNFHHVRKEGLRGSAEGYLTRTSSYST